MFKPILKPRDAEGHTLSFQPRVFSKDVPEQALDFARTQDEKASDFKINDLVAQSTGLSELDRKNFDERLEAEVLARLKPVEEKAYGEAYNLGLKEGREKAFNDSTAFIKEAVQNLESIIASIKNFKKQIFIDNEAHLVKTLFHLAKALALKEISGDQTAILNVLRKALENAQYDEEITIRVNPQDEQFLETVKKDVGSPLERIQKVKLEANEGISRGGCIVETNYGMVDATVEQRIQKLLEVLEGKMPKSEEG